MTKPTRRIDIYKRVGTRLEYVTSTNTAQNLKQAKAEAAEKWPGFEITARYSRPKARRRQRRAQGN